MIKECINSIIAFQIGILIKFHQLINPITDEELNKNGEKTENVKIKKIRVVDKQPRKTNMAFFNGVEVVENFEEYKDEKTIKKINQEYLHKLETIDEENLKLSVEEDFSMPQKTEKDLKEIEEIKKLQNLYLNGGIKKRIIKNNKSPLKNVEDLQEFNADMILDNKEITKLEGKKSWNKTKLC